VPHSPFIVWAAPCTPGGHAQCIRH